MPTSPVKLSAQTVATPPAQRAGSALVNRERAIAFASLDGRIFGWSAAAERIYGYRANEVIGRDSSILVAPHLRAAVQEAIGGVRKAGSSHELDIQGVRKDGTLVDLTLTVSPLRDAAGPITGFAAVSEIRSASRDHHGDSALELQSATPTVLRPADEMRSGARQQAAVAILGTRALSETPVETLMDEAVSLIAATLDVELCDVFQLAPDGDCLVLRSGVGFKEGLVGRATIPAAAGSQAGYTLLSEEPVVMNDLQGETRFEVSGIALDHGMSSGVSTIVPGREPYGIMCAYSREPRGFAQEELHFLQAMANVLAQAIERARAGQELRRSEEYFRSLIENALDIITVVDPTGTIIFQNTALQRTLGYPPVESIGTNIFDVVRRDDCERVREAFEKTLKSPNVPVSVECHFRHMDGTWRVCEVVGKGMFDLDGLPAVVASTRDVTERKRAGRERSLLASIVESSDDAILSFTTEGIITSWNPGAEKLYGFTAAEAIGRSAELFIPPGTHERTQEIFDRVNRGEGLQHYETRRQRKDGVLVDVSVTTSALHDHQGRVTGVSSIARDITERKRTQRQLQESEAWFRGIFEEGPVPVILLGPDFRFINVNEALCQLVEYSRKELLELGPLDLVHPEDRESAMRDLRELRDGAPLRFQAEQRYLSKRGKLLYVTISASQVRNKQGELQHLIATIQDVTERKRAENEIAARAQQQAAVAALGQRGLARADLRDLMDDAVNVLGDTLGLHHASITELMPGGEYLRMLAATGVKHGGLNEVMVPRPSDSLTGYTLISSEPVVVEDYRTEARFKTNPLNEYLGLISAISVIIGEQNRPFGVLSAHSTARREFTRDDINFVQAIANVVGQAVERTRAEEELQRSESHFRSLIESATDGITVIDREGRIQFESPSNEHVTGYARGYWLGRSAFEMIHPDDLPVVAAGIQRAFEDPVVGAPPIEFRLRHRDGSWRGMEASGKLLPVELGSSGVVVNFRDITERKRAEAELAKARDEALEASRLKSSFLANMSHEIRTPINTILGYSDLISETIGDNGDPGLRQCLEAINRGGKRLLYTIQDILDFSRIEAGAFELKKERLALAPLIERQIIDLKVLGEKKGLEMACLIEEPDAEADFDEYCLSNALMNLLQNAIKFTNQGGVWTRLYRAEDGELRLEVRDSGVGIDPNYLPRIFIPFTQEQSGYTRRFEGSGLGLALVKKYLELNGARLSVQSAKNQGSVFTVHFPASSNSAQPAAAVADVRPAAPIATIHEAQQHAVLVVEDDLDTQAFMTALLGGRYRVLLASSADELFVQLDLHGPSISIILMDFSLRGSDDGLTLTARLRSDPRLAHIPIVAVTAHALEEDRKRAIAAGCDDYLSKPVSRQTLIATIERLLPAAAPKETRAQGAASEPHSGKPPQGQARERNPSNSPELN